MAFSMAVQAALAGRTVNSARLVEFDFLSGVARYWNGRGTATFSSVTWAGVGSLGTVEGIEESISTTAPRVSFALSSLDDEAFAAGIGAADEVQGRAVKIWMQLLDVTDAARLTALDDPIQLFEGIMDAPSFDEDRGSRVITVGAESIWTGRRRPAYAWYTDADQQARYPGDLGFAHVASLVTKVTVWPRS